MKARDASASKNNDDYKGESEGQQDHSQDQAECCCVEKGEASFIFIQRTNIETHLWNAFQSVFLQSVPASKLCEFVSIDINAGYEERQLEKLQVIKEKYPGAVSSQPTKKTSNGNTGKDGKKSGKGKGEKILKRKKVV